MQNNSTNPAHERAIRKLQAWQPQAVNVRFTTCHCNKDALMLSYQLLEHDRPRDNGKEDCGYWCTVCDFANAGAREVEE